jgi:alpha-glucan,water dikinase
VRTGGRPSREEALQAVAVINRVRRLLGAISDATVARVAPFATALGRTAKCDSWAVDIFAEEVVRVSAVGAGRGGP